MLLLHPSAAPAGPAAPGRPVASAVTAHDATITWPGGGSGVKYEVFRQNGAVSEQWGGRGGLALAAITCLVAAAGGAIAVRRTGADVTPPPSSVVAAAAET